MCYFAALLPKSPCSPVSPTSPDSGLCVVLLFAAAGAVVAAFVSSTGFPFTVCKLSLMS